MTKFFLSLAMAALLVGPVTISAAETAAEVEQQVKALVAAPEITIVHFWAPWCSNCKTEMRPDGWAKFLRENPGVKVVFVNVWHRGQPPERMLTAGGLGQQKNFIALNHPNRASSGDGHLEEFLGLPLTWVPATWIYREGKLRYALNYGEVRFEMLQQMVKDAATSW